MDCEEVLVSWLKNAYAMEKAMVATLKEHIEDAKDDPMMDSAIEKMSKHIDETEIQAEKVKQAIKSLGEDVSGIKTEFAVGQAKAMGSALDMFKDHGVKNIIIDHASEHLEMATYMAIAKAAELCGKNEIADMAKEIMTQETTTGEKIENEISNAVESYFEKMKVSE